MKEANHITFKYNRNTPTKLFAIAINRLFSNILLFGIILQLTTPTNLKQRQLGHKNFLTSVTNTRP